MRRRFQFSLLGLFLLTALVAVGAAWWRRPQWIVENHGSIELGFYGQRNWDDVTMLEGPAVMSYLADDGSILSTIVTYHSTKRPFNKLSLQILPGQVNGHQANLPREPGDDPFTALNADELQTFRERVVLEYKRLRSTGREPYFRHQEDWRLFPELAEEHRNAYREIPPDGR